MPRWLSQLRDDWHDAATVGFGYGVFPELDGYITDNRRRAVVLDVCADARRTLLGLGDPISGSTLARLHRDHRVAVWTRDVPAQLFLDTADRFVALIREPRLPGT